ncbi:hypothetical protein HJ107_23315 [Vibrio parahaemolyticus]|uniref:hypothetical protein n=1 Tax=Vibrio parahaemolyticus TaxID=670 RepID=UPI00040B4726|nr:hypothetical protein [Vibrio parahaemolyticus]EKH9200317.1 hypothetical protein [Vibrio parahaemolyticus]MBE4089720.1 hypothetical protein [Vibrio parahaemolyticus]MCQ9091979.1 hypothetical protein [Vibrio parahaemolyticus]MCX8804469.1 hypothetical protein [Vibrio parahaemolyticus]OOX32847.1 hypothetical protein BJL83_15605 [Vibrio parahaemolyticus]
MIKQRITHCHLLNTSLDPYALIASKSQRLSWNKTSESEALLRKKEIVEWFALLRNYSEQTVQAILIDGILNNEFHNITFILSLVQKDDFKVVASKQAYQILYEFVSQTPAGIREWIEGKDFLMSRDVLALLSRNR